MTGHPDAIRRIAAREPLRAWGPDMVDLPWGDPEFSERMLREHLDQSHEMASRRNDTIERQVDRLMDWLRLRPGASPADRPGPADRPAQAVLDVTCGPGLFARQFRRRGISVTGVDISPAAIRYAIGITAGLPCAFIQADVREMRLRVAEFDAAIYLYGQSEVARPEDLREILARIRRALRPGAPLAMEIRTAATVP